MTNTNKITAKQLFTSFVNSKIVKRYTKNTLVFIGFFILLEAFMLFAFWLDAIGRGL